MNQNQVEKINRVQRRAHNIICNSDNCSCSIFSYSDLTDRRKCMSKKLFNSSLNSLHPLSHVVLHCLPTGRFNTWHCRTTKRLHSFIPYEANIYNSNFTR